MAYGVRIYLVLRVARKAKRCAGWRRAAFGEDIWANVKAVGRGVWAWASVAAEAQAGK